MANPDHFFATKMISVKAKKFQGYQSYFLSNRQIFLFLTKREVSRVYFGEVWVLILYSLHTEVKFTVLVFYLFIKNKFVLLYIMLLNLQ